MLLQVNLSIFTIGKTPTFHFLSTPSADRSRSARPAGSGQTRRGEGGAYGVQGGGGEYGSEAGVGAAPVDPTGPPAERIGGGGGVNNRSNMAQVVKGVRGEGCVWKCSVARPSHAHIWGGWLQPGPSGHQQHWRIGW